jgi:hypothetical protein
VFGFGIQWFGVELAGFEIDEESVDTSFPTLLPHPLTYRHELRRRTVLFGKPWGFPMVLKHGLQLQYDMENFSTALSNPLYAGSPG